MTIKIQSTMNIGSNGAKVVIYGPAKIGKTRLSLTWPGCVVINTERGLLSLRGTPVPFIEVDDLAKTKEVINWLYSASSSQFPNVIVDSVSDLGEVFLGDHKKNTKDPRKAYGNLQDDIMEAWRCFRDLPNRNVVFIAKETWDTTRVPPTVAPSMPGKYLTQQLPYMFDGIFRLCHFQAGDGLQYIGLHCKSDYQTIAGDRSGRLDEWEEPNLARLFHKILKG